MSVETHTASTLASPAAVPVQPKRLGVFERYLSLWVAACMVTGVALGKLGLDESLSGCPSVEPG